jgi:hypothetical protein
LLALSRAAKEGAPTDGGRVRYIKIPEDQMLLRLRVLLSRKRKLSSTIINDAAGVPSVSSYFKHFGSLRKAFALIGYVRPIAISSIICCCQPTS